MFTSKPIVDKLEKRSLDITSVFTKTVQDLSVVNKEASTKIEENKIAIEALQSENASIEVIANKNQRFIDKITAFVDGE